MATALCVLYFLRVQFFLSFQISYIHALIAFVPLFLCLYKKSKLKAVLSFFPNNRISNLVLRYSVPREPQNFRDIAHIFFYLCYCFETLYSSVLDGLRKA